MLTCIILLLPSVLVITLGIQISPVQSASVDLTIQEKATGEDVVDSTLAKIRLSRIFPQDDFDFLKRLAYFESLYGTRDTTFRTNFTGGIWQLPQSLYTLTKNTTAYPSLVTYIQSINSSFNINWATSTTWNDLLKPLYSALATRLYLKGIQQSIPQTLNNQAQFWVTYLRQPGDTRTKDDFINQITLNENKTGTCTGKMDLLIVCDGSGSIGSTDFAKALNFVSNLALPFSVETVRIGFIIFSDVSTIVFPINHTLNAQEMKSKILNFPYPGGNTYTNDALLTAVSVFNGTKIRSGIPRIMAVLTDGKSTGSDVSNIASVQAANINSFAIGIGTDIDDDELLQIAQKQTSRIFKLDGFDSLVEFYKRLNRETCSIPQKPGLNIITKDTLTSGEKRFYSYPLNGDGLTVVLGDATENDNSGTGTGGSGSVNGYYSYKIDTPNSALNDGILSSGATIIDGKNSDSEGEIHITIQGLDGGSDYMILAYVPANCNVAR